MGQKVCPIGLRLGITESHRSRWYGGKDYAKILANDIKLRSFLKTRLERAAIASIIIERKGEKTEIEIWTARPGIVIGKKGSEVDVLRAELEAIAGGIVDIKIVEVTRPEINSTLVAQSVADQLIGRVAFRRAMRKSVSAAMKSGALGIRIQCSGRLGGAEMGRREWYREGRVPLHTLRAKIDYGFAEAKTTMGIIGIKVWIFHGEVLPGQKSPNPSIEGTRAPRSPRRGGNRRDK
ncbi:MAG: 30S ribosomal protein S3 [Coriobacteriia bacterium]|nr:30S ribosomal protein S3 [Coriobacteriia bacterium]